MAKSNKIIKLAAFVIIGYGVYKAFFAEDNDGYATTYSSASASSGSESKPRGSSSYYVSGRGELSESEYAEYQSQSPSIEERESVLREKIANAESPRAKAEYEAQLTSLKSRSNSSHIVEG